MRSASPAFQAANSEIVARVQGGFTIRDAAAASGVPESTVNYWLAQGRSRPSSPYAGFAETIDAIRKDLDCFRVGDPGPMTEDELLLHLSKAIRKGSVLAAKLWVQCYRPED